MNLFTTSSCPIESAQALDDKRVNSQLKEAAQIMSSAILWNLIPQHMKNGPKHQAQYHREQRFAIRDKLGIVSATHFFHPCCKWAAKTRKNYIWVLEHYIALCDVFKAMKGKPHAYDTEDLRASYEDAMEHIPGGSLLEFQNSAANDSKGISFKHVNPVTEAYRLYLDERWKNDTRAVTWTNRSKPEWSMYECI
jgi:hypothetical protein